MKSKKRIRHAYIHSVRSICGGEPVIRGTRFPVRSVVEYVLRQGMTPEELVHEWSHLNLAQVYDASSYYNDHRAEIARVIRVRSRGAPRKPASV